MSDATTARPLWRRFIGFNLLSGIALLVGGFYLGWWIGHQIHAESLASYLAGREPDDVEARWEELVPPYQGLAANIS